MAAIARLKPYAGPALLSYGFRPFFLAAASWSVLSLAAWLPLLTGQIELPTRFDPLSWHIHEMLFGFIMAAVGGFLLTAIPNWTNRPPVAGVPAGPRAACSAGAAAPGGAGACAKAALATPKMTAPVIKFN